METKIEGLSTRAQLAAWWLLNMAKTAAQKEVERIEAAENAILGRIREQKLEEIQDREKKR
jgi:hypothetical protein